MRRYAPLILALALVGCGATTAAPASTPTPGAVSKLVQQLQAQPPANPPAYLARYSYKGEIVSYIPPRCCDIFGDLYDGTGRLICHPDGGIAGHGDGRCPEFINLRTDEVVLWRDSRTLPSASPS